MATIHPTLLQKLQALPPRRLAEVEAFVEFLAEREVRAVAAERLGESLAKLDSLNLLPISDDEVEVEVEAARRRSCWPREGARRANAMLEAAIRELEEHLSEYVRKAAEGEDVRVSVDGRVVARLVAFPASPGLAALESEPGVTWSGGKPAGLQNPEVVPAGVSLADWVVEDRR